MAGIQDGHENKNALFAALHLVRFWHKADIQLSPGKSAFGGKADMAFCTANVCF
jgi:hypothetical protein